MKFFMFKLNFLHFEASSNIEYNIKNIFYKFDILCTLIKTQENRT